MTYAEKLKDPRWICRRHEILERDGHQCRYCRTQEGPLQVHHTYYAWGKEPWEAEDKHLLTLCRDCHEKRQKTEDDIAQALAEFDYPELIDIAYFLQTAHSPYGRGLSDIAGILEQAIGGE